MSELLTPKEDPVEKGNKKNREWTGSSQTPPARKLVVLTLQSMVENGCPNKHGSFKKISQTFGVHRDTVRSIWKNLGHLAPNGPQNLPAKLFSRRNERGKNKKLVFVADEEFVEYVKTVPIGERQTLRGLASALKVSRGTAHSMVKNGTLGRHTNSLLPLLTEAHKLERLTWCYDHVNHNDADHHFYNTENIIHVDEKWFNQMEITQKMYLADDEEPPARTVKHKSHIPKVMFLAAMARPRFDPVTNTDWDGNIGICALRPLLTLKLKAVSKMKIRL